jgi:hypothetical protein
MKMQLTGCGGEYLGLRGEEVAEGWIKLCSGGIHDFYCLPYLLKGTL